MTKHSKLTESTDSASGTEGESMATEIRLNQAIAFAAMEHAGQLDKAGEPYILHPLRVMLRMTTNEERIVAVLHDVVEDCPDVTLGEIAEKFGMPTALAVDALTHPKCEPRDAYIRRVNSNPIARAVKLLDIADNMDRMHKLPQDVQERLIKKYGDALIILHSCPDFPLPPCTSEASSGVEGAHDGTTADKSDSREPEKLNNAHGEKCFICGEWPSPVAGNPMEWPIRLPFLNGNGKLRTYCTKCVVDALAESSLSSPLPVEIAVEAAIGEMHRMHHEVVEISRKLGLMDDKPKTATQILFEQDALRNCERRMELAIRNAFKRAASPELLPPDK